MLPKETISDFISTINSRIPPPVHTGGIENSRPVPAVIIENVSFEDQNYHNSQFAGNEYDDSGNIVQEIHRNYYDLRLELIVKDDDETDAWGYLGDLKITLGELKANPSAVNDHIREVKPGGSGGVSYEFYEPVETEISHSVTLKTFYDTRRDGDVLEGIVKDYNIS